MAARLFVLLVLLTLLPAAGVLWFMNAAFAAETAAAEQRVREAHRGQLRLVRERLDPLWRAHAERLEAGTVAPGELFTRLIAGDVAEGVIVLDAGGAVVFPDRPARARLADMIRRREREPNAWLPTQAALQLSIDVADVERPMPTPGVIRETTMPGVWALSSSDGRVVALYRTGRLEAMMHDFLHQVETPGMSFIASAPDTPADAEAIAAGPWLPGWQLSFVPLDTAATAAEAAGRRARYLSVGLAGVAGIALIGLAAGHTMRRHLRLARLKTDLVAAVSHELRTPLTSIGVLVDGLLADAEPDSTKTREYLRLIAGENARLIRLVENFLAFSRLEQGRQHFTFAPVMPAAIVDAAVLAMRERLPEGCGLEVDVAADLPPVMADAGAVETALVNLLDNAVKYTPPDKRIAVRVLADGEAFVRFEVADNGIGIPVREQRRIFRRFYRVDRRLSRETAGVGLGLSIVELIAGAHGGTVGVASSPGQGSTFTLRLPCLPDASTT